jgi:hypothetical protein
VVPVRCWAMQCAAEAANKVDHETWAYNLLVVVLLPC